MTNQTNIRQKRYRRLNFFRILGSSVGCSLGIGIIAYITTTTGTVFIMPPFGATCVIAFVIPNSAFAKPRNIICGHFLSSLVGIFCLSYMGIDWWSYAIAVGLCTAIMQLTRTLHPPAAADPVLLIMQGSVSLNFLITPVLLGSCILVLIAMIYNNFIAKRQYPRDINSGGWFGQMFK